MTDNYQTVAGPIGHRQRRQRRHPNMTSPGYMTSALPADVDDWQIIEVAGTRHGSHMEMLSGAVSGIAMTSPELNGWVNYHLPKDTTTFISSGLKDIRLRISGAGFELLGDPISRVWTVSGEVGSAQVLQRVSLVEAQEDAAATFDTAQDTKWLRASLELSMAELASLFGVTRKAAYDWLAGAKTSKAPYIHAVRQMLEAMPSAQRAYLRHFWESAPEGGESLLSILRSGDLSRLSEAQMALKRLEARIADYAQQRAQEPAFDAIGTSHTDSTYRSL